MPWIVGCFRVEKDFWVTPENALEYADRMGEFLGAQLERSGMAGYVLGLSGGIDSAVCAYLCQRAGINPYLMVMPYGKAMDGSDASARVAEIIADLRLEKRSLCVDIELACKGAEVRRDRHIWQFSNSSPHAKANLKLAEGSRRTRQRMLELSDFAQTHRLLVLDTVNLDEYLLGHFIGYDNSVGSVQPLRQCLKSEVYLLGATLGVPESVLKAAPSSELSTGQTDEAYFGFSYEAFDTFIRNNGSCGDAEVDAKIANRYITSQHKRNAPPIFKGYGQTF